MAPVARIERLTEAQKAQMEAHADRWIEVGLRTGSADRERFESAVADCYRFAGLEPPKRVVWVPSPLVMAVAAPAAAFQIEMTRALASRQSIGAAVGGAVGGA